MRPYLMSLPFFQFEKVAIEESPIRFRILNPLEESYSLELGRQL